VNLARGNQRVAERISQDWDKKPPEHSQ
jgi:hypothetical protein